MSSSGPRWWSRYIPSFGSNPFRLALRLLTVENKAARSAMLMAMAGIALTPFDFLLRASERRLYERAKPREKPVILVIGPPRSGTTLVCQYLINTFDVAYLNNLTSLFPRSPIRANMLFGRFAPLGRGEYSAYYGRSRSLSGTNDGLYIWDRWLGASRSVVPESLEGDAAVTMPQFFAALESHYGLPVINKVNRLNTCAGLVAEVLENAQFICLERDPLFLAQSLYLARQEILGDLGTPYGTQHDDSEPNDPIEDVCRQVVFFQEQAIRQQREIGEDRFLVWSYEDFCERPSEFAASLARQHPELCAGDRGGLDDGPFRVSQSRKLPESVMARLEARLNELGARRLSRLHA